MLISRKDWEKYTQKMTLLSEAAGQKMQEYIDKHGIGDRNALIEFANSLVLKYGEGSSALACQLYDELADKSAKNIKPAEPYIPSYGDVAKAVNGTLKYSPEGKLTEGAVQRMVKISGSDTILKNAIRDKAEYAWICDGGSCEYCQLIAGLGWQKASKKILSGGHAEHIHPHCECQFIVSFDGKTNVEGYDMAKYEKLYQETEGKTIEEKAKNLRAERLEVINKPKSVVEDVTSQFLNEANPKSGTVEFKNGTSEVELRDRETATWLNTIFGGNVICLPEKSKDGKNPDALWNNKFWEFKRPTTANAIDDRLRTANEQILAAQTREKKLGEICGVVIDLNKSQLTNEEAIKIIEEKASKRMKMNCNVIIRKGDEAIKVIKITKAPDS